MQRVKTMKINKFKKKHNNLYELTLDNNTKVSLYDEIILKYELLVKKELDIKKLAEITLENAKLESYYIALKFINAKLRTEKEIRKKLNKFNKEAINYTITRLKKEGYLNDLLYIKAYINDSINLKMIGPLKIHYELKKLGFKESDIDNYLNTFNNEIWLDKINKIIKKKINSNHNLSSMMLKQKIMKDLITRGFQKEDILSLIDEYDFYDDDVIYQNEYEKQKNKLSKKYDGEVLEYQIKLALAKKGFRK